MSIKSLLESSESLTIVVLALSSYCDLSLIDHGLVKTVATHWTGWQSTPAVATLSDVVHHLAREDLPVVALDYKAHVGSRSI